MMQIQQPVITGKATVKSIDYIQVPGKPEKGRSQQRYVLLTFRNNLSDRYETGGISAADLKRWGIVPLTKKKAEKVTEYSDNQFIFDPNSLRATWGLWFLRNRFDYENEISESSTDDLVEIQKQHDNRSYLRLFGILALVTVLISIGTLTTAYFVYVNSFSLFISAVIGATSLSLIPHILVIVGVGMTIGFMLSLVMFTAMVIYTGLRTERTINYTEVTENEGVLDLSKLTMGSQENKNEIEQVQKNQGQEREDNKYQEEQQEEEKTEKEPKENEDQGEAKKEEVTLDPKQKSIKSLKVALESGNLETVKSLITGKEGSPLSLDVQLSQDEKSSAQPILHYICGKASYTEADNEIVKYLINIHNENIQLGLKDLLILVDKEGKEPEASQNSVMSLKSNAKAKLINTSLRGIQKEKQEEEKQETQTASTLTDSTEKKKEFKGKDSKKEETDDSRNEKTDSSANESNKEIKEENEKDEKKELNQEDKQKLQKFEEAKKQYLMQLQELLQIESKYTQNMKILKDELEKCDQPKTSGQDDVLTRKEFLKHLGYINEFNQPMVTIADVNISLSEANNIYVKMLGHLNSQQCLDRVIGAEAAISRDSGNINGYLKRLDKAREDQTLPLIRLTSAANEKNLSTADFMIKPVQQIMRRALLIGELLSKYRKLNDELKSSESIFSEREYKALASEIKNHEGNLLKLKERINQFSQGVNQVLKRPEITFKRKTHTGFSTRNLPIDYATASMIGGNINDPTFGDEDSPAFEFQAPIQDFVPQPLLPSIPPHVAMLRDFYKDTFQQKEDISNLLDLLKDNQATGQKADLSNKRVEKLTSALSSAALFSPVGLNANNLDTLKPLQFEAKIEEIKQWTENDLPRYMENIRVLQEARAEVGNELFSIYTNNQDSLSIAKLLVESPDIPKEHLNSLLKAVCEMRQEYAKLKDQSNSGYKQDIADKLAKIEKQVGVAIQFEELEAQTRESKRVSLNLTSPRNQNQ